MRLFPLASSIALLAVALPLTTAAVRAADVMDPVAVVPSLVGYVDIHGGLGGSSYEMIESGFTFEDGEYDIWDYGGAGRVAIPLDAFSLQLDAWFDNLTYDGSYCYLDDCEEDGPYTDMVVGLAGHLAYARDGATVGGMVSLGANDNDDDNYLTAALEATAAFDNFRLYGQGGVVVELSDEEDPNTYFAKGVVAYYIDPNLAVSANAGISTVTYDDDAPGAYELTEVSVGARIEKKFEDLPLSAYLQARYREYHGEETAFPYEQNGSQFTVLGGLRFAFGAETLQDLDTQVGLTDMNPIYGDLPH